VVLSKRVVGIDQVLLARFHNATPFLGERCQDALQQCSSLVAKFLRRSILEQTAFLCVFAR
jgi:hypothetical protein